jgi:agmatine deiminase
VELAPIGSARAAAATSTHSTRMPAEWTPHECCLMAWPTRPELWQGQYEAATVEYAAVAQAIARFEPVLMVAAPGLGDDA